jgi:hypothetical protein
VYDGWLSRCEYLTDVRLKTGEGNQSYRYNSARQTALWTVVSVVMVSRRFVCQIAACKKGPNIKTKDLRTHVYMNLKIVFECGTTHQKSYVNIKSLCMVTGISS